MTDNYPPGARYDPNAPYNEEDAPEIEVLVRTVMTKATTVVGSRDYHCNLLTAYHDQQRTLRQTLGACVKVFDQLRKQGIYKVGQYSLRELRDECDDWDCDELEVTEC